MNPDDLTKILDELSNRLSGPGGHVFELAVRQVYINAVLGLIVLILTVAVGVYCWPRLYQWQDGDETYGTRSMVTFLVGIGYVLVLVGALVYALTTIPMLLNPEYAALRDILRAITGTHL